MIGSLATLLGFQLAGELLARLLGLPVPGPVLGMVMLATVLAAYGNVPAVLRETAQGLLSHLSLLFVPAGVGLMLHGQRLRVDGWALAAALVVSTAVTVSITALVFRAASRRFRESEDRT